MKIYDVRLSRYAIEDLDSILGWGTENWGIEDAEIWLNDLEDRIHNRLSHFPEAFPIAPESDEFDFDVRQLIHGRYRVLYRSNGREVLILRVIGPHSRAANS